MWPIIKLFLILTQIIFIKLKPLSASSLCVSEFHSLSNDVNDRLAEVDNGIQIPEEYFFHFFFLYYSQVTTHTTHF